MLRLNPFDQAQRNFKEGKMSKIVKLLIVVLLVWTTGAFAETKINIPKELSKESFQKFVSQFPQSPLLPLAKAHLKNGA